MKKTALYLLFSVCISVTAQTLPNPGFEIGSTDTTSGLSYPIDWVNDGVGIDLSTTHVSSGTYSAVIWNWYYYGRAFLRNGSAAPMGGSFFFMDGGTPVSGKPSKLSGFYVYDTSQTFSSNDSARVIIGLKRWNAGLGRADTIALSEKNLPGTSTAGPMVPFEVDIQDLMPGADPDSIVVTFVSSVSGFCDSTTAGQCLYLFVDDLSLTITQTDGSQQEVPFLLYPNPARDEIIIPVKGQSVDEIIVYDLQGRKQIQRMVSRNENSIHLPVNELSAGSYWVEIRSTGKSSNHQKLQIR